MGKAQTPRECGTAVASLQNAAVAAVAAGAAIVLLFFLILKMQTGMQHLLESVLRRHKTL
jgi:hypothetical protein